MRRDGVACVLLALGTLWAPVSARAEVPQLTALRFAASTSPTDQFVDVFATDDTRVASVAVDVSDSRGKRSFPSQFPEDVIQKPIFANGELGINIEPGGNASVPPPVLNRPRHDFGHAARQPELELRNRGLRERTMRPL